MPRKRDSTTPKRPAKGKVNLRDPYARKDVVANEVATLKPDPDIDPEPSANAEPKDDAALFRAAVADVTPLHAEETARTGKARPAPIPRQRLRDEAEVLDDSLSDHWDPAEMETGDELFHVRDGLPSTTLRRLRRGAFTRGKRPFSRMEGHAADGSHAEFPRRTRRQGRCAGSQRPADQIFGSQRQRGLNRIYGRPPA